MISVDSVTDRVRWQSVAGNHWKMNTLVSSGICHANMLCFSIHKLGALFKNLVNQKNFSATKMLSIISFKNFLISSSIYFLFLTIKLKLSTLYNSTVVWNWAWRFRFHPGWNRIAIFPSLILIYGLSFIIRKGVRDLAKGKHSKSTSFSNAAFLTVQIAYAI